MQLKGAVMSATGMSRRQLELETQKLELEVKNLKTWWRRWGASVTTVAAFITTVVAVGGFWWSVHQFNTQQSQEHTWRETEFKWRKIEFLTKRVGEFDSDPGVSNTKLMLDSLKLYSKRKIELFPDEKDPEKRYVWVTPEDISSALEPDKEKLAAGNKQKLEKWIAIADCFDVFLSNLEDFDHYIKAGLFTPEDLRLDLIYWLNLLESDKLKGTGFTEKLLKYAKDNDFAGLQSLRWRYGFRDYAK
jgi:hypothetical protein